MRLARAHAGDWQIDPNHIGVIGFSAGGNLAVLLSTHPDDHHVESTPAAHDIPGLAGEASGGIKLTGITDARPNFAIVVYPAYLATPPDNKVLDPVYAPNQFTPPTFLIQAEDDKSYGFNAPIYYQSLAAAKVPAELHMYASGGHGFGIHPPGKPEEHWTRIADIWLRTINMLPPYNPQRPAVVAAPTTIPGAAGTVPCATPPAGPQPPQSSRSTNSPGNTNSAPPADTPCYQ